MLATSAQRQIGLLINFLWESSSDVNKANSIKAKAKARQYKAKAKARGLQGQGQPKQGQGQGLTLQKIKSRS